MLIILQDKVHPLKKWFGKYKENTAFYDSINKTLFLDDRNQLSLNSFTSQHKIYSSQATKPLCIFLPSS